MSDSNQDLWCAVIQQALVDATEPLTPSAAKRLSARMNQLRSREWFTKPNRDFEEVCDLARLDPSRVRSHAIPLIEEAIRLDPSMSQPAPRRRSRIRTITYNGETLSIGDWAQRTGVSYFTLNKRLGAGWPVERVLTKKLPNRAAQELQAESTAQ